MTDEQTTELISQSSSPIAPLLSLVSGLVIMGLAALPIYRSLISWFWPTVDGEIQTTQILRNTSREAQTQKKPFYYTVSYRYTVDNLEYLGSRSHFEVFRSDEIARSGFVSLETASESANKNYPPNGKIKVFYQAKNPEMSVLEPGFTLRTYIVMVLITGLCSYGGYGLIQWSQNK